VEFRGGAYTLGGAWIERLVKDVNFSDYESLQYFHSVLKKQGVIAELERHGVHDGDTVRILDMEFDFTL
jgi:GTP-binding protein